jgi:DNA transposition AAA+ family ATPase
MARHFLELSDAKTMTTTGFALSRRCVVDCVETRAMGVVYGEAGVGKTFAVEHATEKTKIDAHWFTFPKQPAITHIVKAMLVEITGVPHRAERFKLTSDLLAVLAEEPRLIVVDEAQQLNADAFDYLRFLHDDPDTQFALIFVGGNGCWKTLSRYPMLLSRVYRRVGVPQLQEEEVVTLMPQFHTVHAKAKTETLLWIDEMFAQGNFRRWASFTRTVAGLCHDLRVATYDEKVAQAALSLLPNWDVRRAA